MRKKLYATALCLVLMITTLLTACSNNSSQSASSTEAPKAKDTTSKEKVTLNVALWDQTLQKVMDKTLEVYKKDHPNVEVTVTFTPFAEYFNKLQTSMAGKSGPDIFWMNYVNYNKYASLGLLKDLQEPIAKDKLDTSMYHPILNDMFTYKNKKMALPYFLDSIALYYNKQIFDDAKVPYPDKNMTWDDLKTVAQKLTNKEKGIYGFNADLGTQLGTHNFISQNGGYVINKEKTKSGYDMPETQEALKFMKELMDSGVSPSAKTQLETDTRQLFSSGKIAMFYGLPPHAPVYVEALKDKLGVTELPKGKQKATVVNGIAWAMNANTKYQQESWDLLKLLCGPQGETIMAESGISMPAVKDPEINKKWASSIPSLNLQVFVDSLEYGVPRAASINSAEWQKSEKEVTDAFLGKQTIEEATKKLAKNMNDALAKEAQN